MNIIKNYDLVCDCTDNFPSRYLINDACVILKKPNIYGSVSQFEGQVSVFTLADKSPDYRDLVPSPPPPGLILTCAEGGVIGVVPGIIGMIQATEAIKIILRIGTTLDGRVLVFDALKMKFKELSLFHNKERENIKSLIDYDNFCSCDNEEGNPLGIENISMLNFREILEGDRENIVLLDVRNQDEAEKGSIKQSILIME